MRYNKLLSNILRFGIVLAVWITGFISWDSAARGGGQRKAEERRKEQKNKKKQRKYAQAVKQHRHRQSPEVRKRMDSHLQQQKQAYRKGKKKK